MVKIVDGDIEVIYEWVLSFEPMPRFFVLGIGVTLIGFAALLALFECLRPAAPSFFSQERLIASGALLLAGCLLIWRATVSKLHQVSSVTISDTGITFRWKYAKHINSRSSKEEQCVAWHDMDHIEWTEEGLEHEFKQYLTITLKNPIINNKRKFKFLISDTRAYRECHALNSKIPPHAIRPGSVMAALNVI